MHANSYASPVERVWAVAKTIICGAILLFLIAPILVIIPLSFNSVPFFTYPMPGFSLRWYEDFLLNPSWRLALSNSVFVAVFTTILATVLGTVAALGLSRKDMPFRSLIMSIIISPLIVPVVITAVGLYFFYADLGLLNSYTGLILAHTTLATPFVVITVTATLAGFDQSLSRAAAGLGAPPLTVFFKVILPLILPGMISGALFAFGTSFDETVVVLFLAGGEQRTLPKQMFTGLREQISPTITAAATVLIIMSLLMLLTLEFLRRRSQRMRGAE
ncbi:ABC transporter permease [Labrys okinawensis]|uniref:ABC transporter permease n=1 Tax=Labrys okinawensis TaxID=346911 RepID=UPI0039BC6B2B